MTEQQIQERAHQIVSFKRHVLTYSLIVPIFFVLDFWDNGRFEWVFFPTLGWGVGLFAHGMNTYGYGPLSVEREADKLRENYGK